MPVFMRFLVSGGLVLLASAASGCDAASENGGATGFVGIVRGLEANRVVDVAVTDATGAPIFATQGVNLGSARTFVLDTGDLPAEFRVQVTDTAAGQSLGCLVTGYQSGDFVHVNIPTTLAWAYATFASVDPAVAKSAVSAFLALPVGFDYEAGASLLDVHFNEFAFLDKAADAGGLDPYIATQMSRIQAKELYTRPGLQSPISPPSMAGEFTKWAAGQMAGKVVGMATEKALKSIPFIADFFGDKSAEILAAIAEVNAKLDKVIVKLDQVQAQLVVIQQQIAQSTDRLAKLTTDEALKTRYNTLVIQMVDDEQLILSVLDLYRGVLATVKDPTKTPEQWTMAVNSYVRIVTGNVDLMKAVRRLNANLVGDKSLLKDSFLKQMADVVSQVVDPTDPNSVYQGYQLLKMAWLRYRAVEQVALFLVDEAYSSTEISLQPFFDEIWPKFDSEAIVFVEAAYSVVGTVEFTKQIFFKLSIQDPANLPADAIWNEVLDAGGVFGTEAKVDGYDNAISVTFSDRVWTTYNAAVPEGLQASLVLRGLNDAPSSPGVQARAIVFTSGGQKYTTLQFTNIPAGSYRLMLDRWNVSLEPSMRRMTFAFQTGDVSSLFEVSVQQDYFKRYVFFD